MYLEKLSNLPGVSGSEKEVRDYLIQAVKEKGLKYHTDTLGNLFVRSGGKAKEAVPRIMISAHMDEVGLMITHIESSGHLRFLKVGSLDDRVLVSKPVYVGKNRIPGVIGSKPIHLQKPEERKKPLQTEDMYIDIGVKDKAEAEKHVSVGEWVVFQTRCISLGDGCFMGKAFDDRAGCAVLLQLLYEQDLPPFHAVFTAQEEVGARGAQVAAYTVEPEIALIIEATSASDVPETKEEGYATTLGKGPALSIMDSSVLVDRQLLQSLIDVAEKGGIPYQFRRFTGGGTDAGPVALSKGGVKTAVISIPCRYIHSPFSILKETDFYHTVKLIGEFLKSRENSTKEVF